MMKKLSGTKRPINEAKGFQRIMLTLVVLMLASVLVVGAVSAEETTVINLTPGTNSDGVVWSGDSSTGYGLTISQAGNYKLTSEFLVKDRILISAGNVKIDGDNKLITISEIARQDPLILVQASDKNLVTLENVNITCEKGVQCIGGDSVLKFMTKAVLKNSKLDLSNYVDSGYGAAINTVGISGSDATGSEIVGNTIYGGGMSAKGTQNQVVLISSSDDVLIQGNTIYMGIAVENGVGKTSSAVRVMNAETNNARIIENTIVAPSNSNDVTRYNGIHITPVSLIGKDLEFTITGNMFTLNKENTAVTIQLSGSTPVNMPLKLTVTDNKFTAGSGADKGMVFVEPSKAVSIVLTADIKNNDFDTFVPDYIVDSAVTAVTISGDDAIYTEATTATLKADVSPENQNVKYEVAWEITDGTDAINFVKDTESLTTITGVTGEEVTYKPLKTGTATVTATVSGKTATFTVTVTEKPTTITFKETGDSIIEPIIQVPGTEVKVPANPTKVGYTFLNWNPEIPEIMPDADLEIIAQWKINTTTITIVDGDKVLKSITQDYGTEVKEELPIPTKEGYVFKGWEPVLPTTMPANDLTIKAQWAVKEEEKEENTGTTETAGSKTEPDVPGTFGTEGEKTVFTPDNAEEAPVVEKTGDKTTVTIPVASGVSLTLTSTEAVTSGAGNSVMGKFDTVEATFANKAADVTTSEKPISYGLVIPLDPEVLKTGDVPLPTIDSTFKEDTGNKVANHNGNSYKALSMITATHTNGITAVNSKIVGEITVTFTLPANIAQNIVVFHVKDDQEKPVLLKTEMKRDRVTGDIIITAKGDGFSSYVVAQDTTPRSGSSTPQGSSVWLQEPLTPTPTETAQPTPTDVAPTDVPTTQPTPTQTETPGFGVLAVLAGLGAVAVLRRK